MRASDLITRYSWQFWLASVIPRVCECVCTSPRYEQQRQAKLLPDLLPVLLNLSLAGPLAILGPLCLASLGLEGITFTEFTFDSLESRKLLTKGHIINLIGSLARQTQAKCTGPGRRWTAYNNYQPFCYLKSNNNVNMYHLLGWLMYKTIVGNN